MFDVITIGTATRDIFLTSPVFKVLHDPEHLRKIGFPTGEAQCFTLGGKVEVDEPIFTCGGGAFNSATTFSRQGFKSAALIKVGRDETGKNILSELKREKITPLAIRAKNKTTAFSVVLLSSSGERTILVYRGASEDLKSKGISFNSLKSRWVYISPGKISFEVIEKLFNYFSKNKTLIAFNPSRYYLEMRLNKLKPLLKKTKVVILNREEGAYLTGINYENERSIFNNLDEAITGIAIMTDGNDGVMVSDGKNIYSSGIFKGKLIDRTGAGDAFGSGFVAGLMRQNLTPKAYNLKPIIEYAIRLGSANATSVVERIGAQEGILTKEEFEKSKRWQKLQIKIN